MESDSSLFITSLNSGSNGNCYYIGTSDDAILIDAGISCRETERRMNRLGLSPLNLRAIFISHEHTDHITGLAMLSKKYNLPVYITERTLRSSGLFIRQELVRAFSAYKPVEIGALSITAFPKFHDADDPHSFMISGHQVNIGVFTDIGYCCEHVQFHFTECHAAFLESNYCEDMLMGGNYPEHLKRRISGKKGHLSNRQALDLFKHYRGTHLTHLLLSHLSHNNNRPELVQELFGREAGTTKIIVASRKEETAVYEIRKSDYHPISPKKMPVPVKRGKRVLQNQLSLFD